MDLGWSTIKLSVDRFVNHYSWWNKHQPSSTRYTHPQAQDSNDKQSTNHRPQNMVPTTEPRHCRAVLATQLKNTWGYYDLCLPRVTSSLLTSKIACSICLPPCWFVNGQWSMSSFFTDGNGCRVETMLRCWCSMTKLETHNVDSIVVECRVRGRSLAVALLRVRGGWWQGETQKSKGSKTREKHMYDKERNDAQIEI